VNIPDDAGGFRQISPEGYVAGVRARAHEQVGPWRAPAGEIAAANSILGLAVNYTLAESQQLDAARVSVIRTVADSVRLYGWRSLSANEADFKFLSGREVLNRLVIEGEAALEEFVFQPIDPKGQLLSAVNAALVGVAEAKRQAGGLYELVNPSTGQLVDPGYKVDTGSSVNSAQSLANNEVRARLAVRIAPTGALVSLTIVKVGISSGL
jgi:phage tail sheath protein FI